MVNFIIRMSVVAILSFVLCQPSYADNRRDKVKAVFLYKFFDYVSWEGSHSPKINSPAVLCVLGDIPFAETLSYLSKKQQQRLVNKIVYLKDINQAGKCHILYMAGSHKATIRKKTILHVLTVSDNAGFAKNGGMIELQDTPNKLKLVVNLGKVKEGNLKISSGLLKISEVIR